VLHELTLEPPVSLPVGPTPHFLLPIAEAATGGGSVGAALAEVVHHLGFDTFTYGCGTAPTPTRESRSYVWTNLPLEWVRRYDQNSYVEVDPRVTDAIMHTTPLLWDRFAFPNTRRLRAFFDDAAKFGVCSGVAVGLRDPLRALAGFYLGSARPKIDDAERVRFFNIQGDILLLAHFIHALLTTNVMGRGLPAPSIGAALSPRERECLQLAAKGLSSSQIAATLGIGERTVHFHIGNLLSKLGVGNRHEAIARAVSAGFISA
jgi:LuxR family transcriptional regulator, quorum-sensing system regulator SolR